MKNCDQNESQTIYEHGVSVRDHLKQLLDYIHHDYALDENWRVPDWLTENKELIKSKLLPSSIALEYALFHDVGKPLCRTVDEDGKVHFPDHAAVSANYWLVNGGNPQIGRLIRMDMDIHLLKDKGVAEFSKRSECCTLLLAGLAEVHSNAAMFGGKESTSFKIKWKQIRKRGSAIFKILV
jgi:hypothetical protein